MPNKFYLTTPIYYVNARPHIGHAYSTIVADVLARRHRLSGDDTYFLTGTDEHGQKIERAAAAAGIPPQQYADQVSKTFSDLWARMGITHDQFIRTTGDGHKQGVQKLFADLYANGQIYLSSYTGQYSVGEEMFVEGPPGTIGPDGRPTETVTEENFFFRLSDYQLPLLNLIEGDDPVLKITPESSKNEVLAFLRGDTLQEPTERPDLYEKGDQPNSLIVSGNSIKKHIDAACESGKLKRSAAGTPYLPGALRDLSVSRSSFTWGIPVPEPAASETKQKHVIYVWLDALANYMTALGYGSTKADGSPDDALWQKFWPADIHLVGKEITRFHCVYWPAFLLALNPEGATKPGAPGLDSETWVSREAKRPRLTFEQHKAWAEKWLPKQVTANGWLLFDNSKMSKSKGNVVRTETILDAFGTLCPPGVASASTPGAATDPGVAAGFSPRETGTQEEGALAPEAQPTPHDRDLFAADILRYYLLREIPFGQDGSFSFDSLITRYNADLANGYGNLVSRTLGLVLQNFPEGLPLALKPWLCADRHVFWGDDLPTKPFEAESGTRFIIERISQAITFPEEYLWPSTKPQIYLAELALRVSHIDHYLSFHKPWMLAKSSDETDKKKLVEVLYTAAESIRIITILLHPILPYATTRVWQQLGLDPAQLTTPNSEQNTLTWGGLKPGTPLGPLSPIFPRADKSLAETMTQMENPAAKPIETKPEASLKSATTPTPAAPVTTNTLDPAAPPRSFTEAGSERHVAGSAALTTGPSPLTPLPATPALDNTITIDDFAKVELRVARILVCERIPKADKLLRLEVDLGPMGTRQILSGIAEWYTPEDLIGRHIIVVTNLAPRKMRGLESHGMLLAGSEGDNGKPILATMSEDIALGTRLK